MTSVAVLVRDAGSADEAAVVALWRSCGLVVSQNDPWIDVRFALAGATSTVLVGTISETIVGTVMVGHDGHRGWLYYVAVDPGRRGRGIGRLMVDGAEAWLAARGVPKAQVMIRDTNAAVAGFYAKLGYDVVPRVVMRKRL